MEKQSFNTGWRFHLGDPDWRLWGNPDDSAWRILSLPHDWSIELPRGAHEVSGSAGGFFAMGRGWYRKTFTAPESWRGKYIYVEFEGVYMNAAIWLNEHFLTRHPYGYTSFTVDLSPFLKIGEENVLRVMVDNSHQLNSRWYSGSGIYRPVWLLEANPLHIDQYGVFITTPQVNWQSAVVEICTRVVNSGTAPVEAALRSNVYTPQGELYGKVITRQVIAPRATAEITQQVQVKNPALWSIETPHLYRLESEVRHDDALMDTLTTNFGIRWLEFTPEEGFKLNGEVVHLRGGCVHHDNGILGAASFARSEERKVEVHKASGFNAIRCAHNPPAPAFLDACDRLGMLVIDEAFDCWRDGKNVGDYHVAFDDWWQRDIQSMVLRDRNHPSIILWSIGNELLERDRIPEGGQIARMLSEEVHRLDPTRPTTAAICGAWGPEGDWDKTAATFAALGVGGYNYQWLNYQPDHEKHPQRMMVGLESFPMQSFENWMQVLDYPYVLGDFVWTSLDYLGEAGIGRVHRDPPHQFLGKYPWHQANCGDLDLCGFKRPQSYYRDMLWGVGEPLYIAVHTPAPEGVELNVSMWGWHDVWHNWNWEGQEGKKFKVEVYSRCEEVELFLNGESLGRQPTTRVERFTAAFEVAYQPGELKAIGYCKGKPAAKYILPTVGKPAALRLTADRPEIGAGEGNLAFIIVEVVDDQGRVHPTAQHAIFFATEGVGTIRAVGSSNPISEEMYVGNTRKAFRGRCLVALQPTGEAGTITLRAMADGLAPAEVTIQAG